MIKNIKQALQVLSDLGLPHAQHNERSALCLLALLDLTREKTWALASNPLMGITPIMDWARLHYQKKYAPNTRETIRRQSMHQFVDAGIAVYNPDEPSRPVNSPYAVYQIENAALALLRCVSSSPAAAAATLRSRAAVDQINEEEIDEIGRRTVLDQDDADAVIPLDFTPGSAVEQNAETTRRKLLEFARKAEAIKPEQDNKLQGAVRELQALLKAGLYPIVFCRFVHTADYVAEQLRRLLPKVRIVAVTGNLPPEERE